MVQKFTQVRIEDTRNGAETVGHFQNVVVLHVSGTRF